MKKECSRTFLWIVYWIAFLFIMIPLLSFFDKDYFMGLGAADVMFIMEALKVTFFCSMIAMVIVALVGLPAGYYMARYDFKGKHIMDMLFHIPTMLPPAVIGLILLMTFGTKGVIGKYLYQLGFSLTFSKSAVILVLVFVSLPIFVNGVCEGFKKVDRDLEITAMTLGDSPLLVFKRVTYPLAKGSIYTSFIMAWARGIAEFGATMMFAGNITGVTQTIPLAIYYSMESNMNLAMFLSFLMMVLSLAILITVRLITFEKKH